MHPAINCLPLYLKWQLSGQPRPRVITTFHDLREPYLFPKAGLVRRWVTQLLLRTSDYAVVTNPADYIRALDLGVRRQRLKLIPIGSNIRPLPKPSTEERQCWRQKLGIAPGQFAVGYFGLLNHSKGLDTLLEALAQLTDIDWKLIIIGGETGASDPTNQIYAHELATLEKRLRISHKVIRTAHLATTETSQALYALDVAALPFRDGASLRRGSLLAALAHALPIITTLPQPVAVTDEVNSGLPQLLHLHNSYLINSENAASLAQALRILQGDFNLRSKLGSAAAKMAHENFSWSTIASALLEVYLAC